ncbi:MAG: class I SAM-dependent methyltransferase [Candidatus Riflebacteria bacterium]|nr:class I SAM-dependent methyltransferase [Candidatus Riflebacteria bacterium]
MKNPWLMIPASDYENHMSSPEVQQAQFLSAKLKEVIADVKPDSVLIAGCSTGNGFEHLTNTCVRKVIGVDINRSYLDILRKRFTCRLKDLQLICSNIEECELPKESVDLIHCGLVFEYIEIGKSLEKICSWLSKGGVLSVILQMPSEKHKSVTETKYVSLKGLETIMHLVDPEQFNEAAVNAGYKIGNNKIETLESGKQFYVATYRK